MRAFLPRTRQFAALPTCPLCYNWAMKTFKQVTETVVDSRKRISLGKAGVAQDTRYAVSVSDDGDILLTPLASIPARERWVWERPELIASIRQGMEQAARGETHYLGSFAEYLDSDAEDES